MSTDQEQTASRFTGLHAETTGRVLKAFYEVYNELGGGFLESVYHEALAMVLRETGLTLRSQYPSLYDFEGRLSGISELT